ncbi:AI-2E family transporter [Luteolibacter sp. GHJ8]|uniref:AI-2E family transporter n=1 Tax=Luteolibacter rhizosphaerae TaxID=2989719 RepID=A0ABT3G1D4_9BACT|nr:AI-2E family transporter [Luteolibacter rhizosphaerae]MCW1913635.1 AI-2E family transporter [Luteolibacter rhizosphaerae]
MARYPTRFQLRTLWNAATGVSILVLGALLVGLIWLIGKIFGFLQPVLVPLAVAAITAYLLDPVVRLFQKRGFSRRWSVVSVFATFTLLVAGLVAIMIPLVGGQIHEFQEQREAMAATAQAQTPAEQQAIAENPAAAKKPIDELIVDILIDTRNKSEWSKPFIDPLLAPPKAPWQEASAKTEQQLGVEIVNPPKADIGAELDAAFREKRSVEPPILLEETELWVQAKTYLDEIFGWIKGGAGKVLGFLGLALGFLMVPIYLYYILNESAAIKEHWHDYVPLKASRFKTELVETLTEINRYLISFFRGQVLVAFIDGMLVGIALTIFGLPLGLLIGILMAILGIIPYIGNIITLIPACVLAWFHFSVPENQGWLGANPWTYVGTVVAIFVIVQQINSLVTAPKIVGDSVGLHPMTVIFSMLFWSLILGGFVGALLAVPLTAAVKVLFRRYIWERKIKEETDQRDDGYEEWEPSESET